MKRKTYYPSFKKEFIHEHGLTTKGLTKQGYKDRESLLRLLFKYQLSCPYAYNIDVALTGNNMAKLIAMTELVMNASNIDKFVISTLTLYITNFYDKHNLYKNRDNYRFSYVKLMKTIFGAMERNSVIQEGIQKITGI